MSLISKINQYRSGLVIPNTTVNWSPPKIAKPIATVRHDDKEPLKFVGASEVPIPAYQFSVEMDGQVVALFQKFSGMKVERKVEPWTEGGMNERTLEFPGQMSYAHVKLEGGQSTSNFFWDWMKAGQFAGWAMAKNFTLAQRRPSDDKNQYWEIAREWFFINAFPVAWEISDLNVAESSNIVIETLELTFDYFELYQP